MIEALGAIAKMQNEITRLHQENIKLLALLKVVREMDDTIKYLLASDDPATYEAGDRLAEAREECADIEVE